jgi:hypothetical protein
MANACGFKVGLVTNAYWATNAKDTVEWLKPMAGAVRDFSVSCDLYHSDEKVSIQAGHAVEAAKQLGIPVSLISIAQPNEMEKGELPPDESSLKYRGRAAEALTENAGLHSWEQFTSCPYEELEEPSRVHLDPFGYVHVCQGITIGNVFDIPLSQIIGDYDPEAHSIIGPIVQRGPAALFQPEVMNSRYADACHLCFSARKILRSRFPEILAPGQMYGIESS